MPEDEIPYIDEPRTLKDIGHNMKLLIYKFNHEHTEMVKDVDTLKKNHELMKKDVSIIKTSVLAFSENFKGMSLLLKFIGGFIGAVGILISIGALLS